jgi:hypothetical protein
MPYTAIMARRQGECPYRSATGERAKRRSGEGRGSGVVPRPGEERPKEPGLTATATRERGFDRGGIFYKHNTGGKRSITLDLKQPRRPRSPSFFERTDVDLEGPRRARLAG